MKTIYIFLVAAVVFISSKSQAVELTPENLNFDYMSSEGSFWLDCVHGKGEQPHQWKLKCGRQNVEFNIHLLLREYKDAEKNEVTVEFHYWADRFSDKLSSATQSTWITLDKNSKTKKIIGYLGFDNDANQLRMEIQL